MSDDLNARNILVMRGGALGDFVLTLPALAALRRRFPAARLEILGYPRIAALAQAGGLADAVHSIEARELASWFAPESPVTNRFGGFDLIVSYIFDPEKIFQANIRRNAPGAVFLTGPHRPNDGGSQHATDVLLEPLRALGIYDADPEPRLLLPDNSPRGNWLALHPGSGSERKNWPEAKWGRLLELIVEKSEWNCLLVGGEAEEGRLERLAARGGARIEMAQNQPLPDLAQRLQGCAAFIGHDSGVTHLTAAVGLPGLALWGETNEKVWRPRSERMKILRHEGGLGRLEVEEVFSELVLLSSIKS